ncbi:5-methylcytosine-specific restriction protein A [Oxalobacteraceae bacterium GrIS 1.11]
MPKRAKSICRQARCGALLDAPGYCDKHLKAKRQQDDAYRGTAQERGYTSAWSKARGFYLRKHPLCLYCERAGRITAAAVVDHIIAHRLREAIDSGDEVRIEAARALFWDSDNWQSLCGHCHDSVKQREEKAAERLRRQEASQDAPGSAVRN